MASRVGGGLLHDQNLKNIHYNENSAGLKTNISKATRKGGRTALGDLSNTMKPSLIPTAKKPNPPTLFSLAEEDASASQALRRGSKKQSSSKPSLNLQSGGRKALSDISNTEKNTVNETSKKSRHSTKLKVVAEEPIHVGEEQFLHNHQECIKAQSRALDLDEFLQIVGLRDDSSKGLATPRAHPHSLVSVSLVESPLKHLELNEVAEKLMDYDQSSNPESPLHCSSPTSPKNHMLWMDHDCVNFKLMESP